MSTSKVYRFHPVLLDLFKKPYKFQDLLDDILAGITVGFVALPIAIGFSVASIPQGVHTPYPIPAIGIITAIIAGFLVSLFGGTYFQVAGPAATLIPVSILIIQQFGFDGLLIATFLAGIILTLCGFFKIGSLMKYLPWSVVSGFTTGIAITIIMDEIEDFFGIHSSLPKPNPFLDQIAWFYENAHAYTLSSIIIASATLLFIYFWRKKGFKLIPAPIVGLLLVTSIVYLLPSHILGPLITIGSKFGATALPNSLPSLHWPAVKMHQLPALFITSFAIVIICSIEALLAAVITDRLTGKSHYRNTELIAQGISNMVVPLFGGLPSTGIIARTSLNVKSGAHSPIAGMIHSATLLFIVFLFSKYVTYLPMGVVAAILISVAISIGEWRDLRRLFQIPLSERCILLTAMILTVVFDIVVALEASMLFAGMVFIQRITEATEISHTTTDDLPKSLRSTLPDETIPEGVIICKIKGPFLFGAAEKLEQTFQEKDPMPTIFILNLELVSVMDATALNVIEIISKEIHQSGGALIINGVNSINRTLMQRAKFIKFIGEKNFCSNLKQSLERSCELMPYLATT
ncbi:MAG: SulP family inorganic anion transporter [Chthoniobacterales bacterium]|nr:SulP family inorganic anion transporter [Chthoniobacterales bacterium]